MLHCLDDFEQPYLLTYLAAPGRPSHPLAAPCTPHRLRFPYVHGRFPYVHVQMSQAPLVITPYGVQAQVERQVPLVITPYCAVCRRRWSPKSR
jgi:hypothetical protein